MTTWFLILKKIWYMQLWNGCNLTRKADSLSSSASCKASDWNILPWNSWNGFRKTLTFRAVPNADKLSRERKKSFIKRSWTGKASSPNTNDTMLPPTMKVTENTFSRLPIVLTKKGRTDLDHFERMVVQICGSEWTARISWRKTGTRTGRWTEDVRNPNKHWWETQSERMANQIWDLKWTRSCFLRKARTRMDPWTSAAVLAK